MLDASRNSLLYHKDSSFRIVAGLAGKGLSLQSINYPDRFIRHRGNLLYLEKKDKSKLFKGDASFLPRRGFTSTRKKFSMSFESVNKPGWFIRNSRYRLRISKYERSTTFAKDASWVPSSKCTFKLLRN